MQQIASQNKPQSENLREHKNQSNQSVSSSSRGLKRAAVCDCRLFSYLFFKHELSRDSSVCENSRKERHMLARYSYCFVTYWVHLCLKKVREKIGSATITKKGKRKVQGVTQSQTAALPRHQEEEETDKSKQAQIETRGPWWSYIAHLTKQICIFTVEVSAKFSALGFLYKLYSTNHPHPPPPHPWPCFFLQILTTWTES